MRDAKSDRKCLKPEEGFEPYITKPVVAERMDVEIRTVSRLMRRRVLRHYKVGPMVRFKWSEVETDLREHFQVCFDPRTPGRGTEQSRGTGAHAETLKSETLQPEMRRTGGGR